MMAYPRQGPMKGIQRKVDVDKARQCGGNTSEFVPAPTASTGDPAMPAKNRQMTILANVLLNPAPSVNSMLIGRERRYTISRP